MISANSKRDAEIEFMKQMKINNSRNIIITNITIIKEFRGAH
ncbi:hypothetical protein QBE52_09745 [Clostridiaceae bacterium 35-E11]